MKIKFVYFTQGYIYNHLLPSLFFRWNYKRLKKCEKEYSEDVIHQRLDYYCKLDGTYKMPSESIQIKNFKKGAKGTVYYLDLKEFLHYFNPNSKITYHFGDETHVNVYPTLFKARPLGVPNENSILFKLEKWRHFRWVKDPYKFEDKEDKLVWRGWAHQPLRQSLVKKYYEHPRFEVGQTNKIKEDVPWQKEFMPIEEQLKYKFIICPEGNDVATSLKWAMSSNSLCFLPTPTCETWFMEGTLKAGVHYVEIKEDLSDIEELMDYYSTNVGEAEEIIQNAHNHVKRFQDKDLEDLLCLKVLERYMELYDQKDFLRFR